MCLIGCSGGPGGGTCVPAIGEYGLTSVGAGFGTCDPTTVAAMELEIQNEADLLGTLCVLASTPCGPIGTSSSGPFTPLLNAQATALGVTGAMFTLTRSGGCVERFAATFEYQGPPGGRCAAP
jgi:hypothetical protein